jgi:glutathione reductase (NADPH)
VATDFEYDLLVIGAGSGGVRAARMSAAYGAKVAIVEEFRVGGTCVIRGCVPKKLYVYASHFREEFEDAAGFGWQVPPATFDWPTLRRNKDTEIDRLNAIYTRNLGASGVEIIAGRARLTGPHEVRIGDRNISARYILIAVGATPNVCQRQSRLSAAAISLSSLLVFSTAWASKPISFIAASKFYVALMTIFANI